MFADVCFLAINLSAYVIESALMFALFSRTLLIFTLTISNHNNRHSALKTNLSIPIDMYQLVKQCNIYGILIVGVIETESILMLLSKNTFR